MGRIGVVHLAQNRDNLRSVVNTLLTGQD